MVNHRSLELTLIFIINITSSQKYSISSHQNKHLKILSAIIGIHLDFRIFRITDLLTFLCNILVLGAMLFVYRELFVSFAFVHYKPYFKAIALGQI